MLSRVLGRQQLVVSSLGFGCMRMSDFYGGADENESIRVIHRAIELGSTLFDTSDAYGPFKNEELLGRAAVGRRDTLIIATKFGIVRAPTGERIGVSGRPEYVRSACEASLRRLKIDTIDLYYQHRVDPNTPIEETVGAMGGLVKEGKARFIGLSEAAAATVRRAQKIHPITALQTEYSLWSRDIEAEILPTLRALGIGLVSYAALGRGFLTGTIKPEELKQGDSRRNMPRFTGENYRMNRALVAKIADVAARRGGTASQIAIAWILAQGDFTVPIPGTRRIKWLEENVFALDVKLTQDEVKELSDAFALGAAVPITGWSRVLES
ncbi:aldo/keto reductase [Bradyrhizobium sp. BWA-3-5]|uniref:aldo/keto reductase n=1 Tax=Bradyrhizobium sp. BWA-3-5 TaxID=3080013 RepID=UPI00293EF0D0|nr:aldo/keto reductase [Bradyrhizobium sp. BWA-3-5]WOH63762.1 aldo/keto reductase [Bradyrhizobium sp. BWA-3-5]